MDVLALLYALLGGFFMGTYPVPIKSPRVLEADVHPVVFQCYKSLLVFLTGFLFLVPRALGPRDDGTAVFEFSWWGVASAAGWIPSGLTTIFAVPIIGVGLTVAVAAAMGSGPIPGASAQRISSADLLVPRASKIRQSIV